MFIRLPNAYGDAFTNMAVDAALLETVPPGAVCLRHYGWSEPAFTYGYSQSLEAVRTVLPDGVQACRRMSGGGIVDHRNDWTYALHLHSEAACAQTRPTTLYALVHQAIADALRATGQDCQLAPCPRHCSERPPLASGPETCFLQPVMNDVLNAEGRKVAGAAMKRTRSCLLLQGSIDRSALPAAIDFNQFAGHFASALASALDLKPEHPDDLRPFFNRALIEQNKALFASADWAGRR